MHPNAILDDAPGGDDAHEAAVLHRCVRACDLDAVRARSAGGALDRLVLQPRFGSFDAFLRDAMDARIRRAFHLSVDGTGRVPGWIACLRFHEREGYAGTAQCLAEVGPTRLDRRAAAAQLALCIADCQAQGVNTLVATLHGAMAEAIAWHIEQGFRACGSVALSAGERLHVLARRIDP
jgi:L-amino acid N-acyltransferase YncA